jgi:hypothetical protein
LSFFVVVVTQPRHVIYTMHFFLAEDIGFNLNGRPRSRTKSDLAEIEIVLNKIQTRCDNKSSSRVKKCIEVNTLMAGRMNCQTKDP